MAKGKQAIKSANRRYEASLQHIDRLTSELVDAKARARQFEREATRATVLDGELARLRIQLDENTNDRLDEQRDLHEAQIADVTERLDGLAFLLRSVMERCDGTLSRDEWTEFVRCFGRDLTHWNPELFHNRHHRRNSATAGQMQRLNNAYKALEQRVGPA